MSFNPITNYVPVEQQSTRGQQAFLQQGNLSSHTVTVIQTDLKFSKGIPSHIYIPPRGLVGDVKEQPRITSSQFPNI